MKKLIKKIWEKITKKAYIADLEDSIRTLETNLKTTQNKFNNKREENKNLKSKSTRLENEVDRLVKIRNDQTVKLMRHEEEINRLKKLIEVHSANEKKALNKSADLEAELTDLKHDMKHTVKSDETKTPVDYDTFKASVAGISNTANQQKKGKLKAENKVKRDK